MPAQPVSLTLDSAFCLGALEETITRYGRPIMMIVNTDQVAQFTSTAFTGALRARGKRISTDGRGCWRDNIFVERLWRAVKYEEVYLHAYETVSDVRSGLARYFQFFNQRRPHSALARRTPD